MTLLYEVSSFFGPDRPNQPSLRIVRDDRDESTSEISEGGSENRLKRGTWNVESRVSSPLIGQPQENKIPAKSFGHRGPCFFLRSFAKSHRTPFWMSG